MLRVAAKKAATSRSPSYGIAKTSSHEKRLLQMPGALAEFECSLISELTRAGVSEAKRRGMNVGWTQAHRRPARPGADDDRDRSFCGGRGAQRGDPPGGLSSAYDPATTQDQPSFSTTLFSRMSRHPSRRASMRDAASMVATGR